MRNPSRNAAISAGLLALAAVAGWIADHRYHADRGGLGRHRPVRLCGSDRPVRARGAGPGAAVRARQGQARRGHRTASRSGTSCAEEWDRFRAFDAARVAAYGETSRNDLRIRELTPPEGVEVVVGRNVADRRRLLSRAAPQRLARAAQRQLGRQFGDAEAPAGLPRVQAVLPGEPLRYRYSTHLRVPIPAAAFAQARLAYDNFAPKIARRRAARPIALLNPVRTLQVCGALLLAQPRGGRLGVARGRPVGPDDRQHRCAAGRADPRGRNSRPSR